MSRGNTFEKYSILILTILFLNVTTYIVMVRKSLEKQAQNRNETDSNLSLGVRLTRVKRLSRKRCCDTIRAAARMVFVSLSCLAYHKMLRLLPKSNVGGIPAPEVHHEENTPNVDACARIHFQMKISDLSVCTNPKNLAFLQIQTSLFNLQSTNCSL